jgi:hypothetical protein
MDIRRRNLIPSSIVPHWLEVICRNDGWIEKPKLIQTIDVKVTTLDRLIDTFGMPDFIKIDVEGFELSVLRGLSRTPRFLSFEFNAETTESTLACIDRFRGFTFNYLIGEPRGHAQLALSSFVDDTRMSELAYTVLADCRTFGDIFVRQPNTGQH